MVKRLLVLLADGFEEIETVIPVDLLRRGGVEVVLASISGEIALRGAHQIALIADELLENLSAVDFDAVFLPGGSEGVDRLLADSRVALIAREILARGAVLAAICAAPKVLAAAGLLEGRTVTSYPSVRSEVEPAAGRYSEERVVLDGSLLTSRGPGTAADFALELLSDRKSVV